MVAEVEAQGLPVNEKKLVVLTTAAISKASPCWKTRRWKLALRLQARNLGFDYGPGAKRFVQNVRLKRLGDVRRRARRFQMLDKRGTLAVRYINAGLKPAAVYGAALHPFALSHLRHLRTSCRVALTRKGKMTAKSSTMWFAVLGMEPARAVTAAPVLALAAAAQTKLLGRTMLAAVLDIVGTAMPRGCPMGPVATCSKALRSLGWVHVNAFVWKDVFGHKLDLEAISLSELREVLTSSVDMRLWQDAKTRHCMYAHLPSSPFLKSIRRLAKHSGVKTLRVPQLTPSEWNRLLTYLCDGFPWHVCRCGYVASERGGTLWEHFAWDCQLTYFYRIQYGFEDAFLRSMTRLPLHPALATGIFPDPEPPLLSQSQDPVWFLFDEEVSSPMFSGPCFGDGTEKHGLSAWCVVEVSLWVMPTIVYKRLSGVLEGRHQNNNGSELCALLYWVLNLDPSGSRHTYFGDSQWVISGWTGEMLVTAWTPFYQIWQRLFQAKADLSFPVSVRKTKGHMKLSACTSPEQVWQRHGNILADRGAKAVLEGIPAARQHFLRVSQVMLVSTRILLYYCLLYTSPSPRD